MVVSFTRTVFGMSANLEVPSDADVVIICKNSGGGLQPITLLLPHQLYRKDLTQIMRDIGGSYHGEVVAIPGRSKEYITVAEKRYV